MRRRISEELVERARALRAETPGVGWGVLARLVGVSSTGLRRRLDPDFRVANNAASQRKARQRGYPYRTGGRRALGIEAPERFWVPEHVIAEAARRAAEAERASLTAQLMGDPTPGRSALAQRGERA